MKENERYALSAVPVAWISSDYFKSLFISLSNHIAERRKRLEAIGWNSGYGSRHFLELSKLYKNLSDDDLYILWHCSSFFNLSLAKEQLENTSHQPNCLT